MSQSLDTLALITPPRGDIQVSSGKIDSSVLGALQITTPEGRYILSGDIDFGAMGVEEVFQNVKYILLTEYFSVPLDREFGMDFTMVDKPIPIAEAMLTQEIAIKIGLYEPRCQFTEIQFDGKAIEGKLSPNVTITILSTDETPSRYPSITPTPTSALVTSIVTTVVPTPDFWKVLLNIAHVPGPPGPPGTSAIVTAGDTTTSAPGTNAMVTNVGPSPSVAIFDFIIPRGSQWFTGASDPPLDLPGSMPGDYYLNTTSGDVFIFS